MASVLPAILRSSASLACLVLSLCLARGDAADSAPSATRKLTIVSARWGDVAGGKAADVTSRLSAMATDAGLFLVANAATLGDAKTTERKQLKIGYTIDGVYASKTVNDGDDFDISLRLVIRKAVYGNLPDGPSADVTEDVADLVRKNTLSADASNELFGDPASGLVKKLRVDYWLGGESKSKMVTENQTLTLP